MASSIKALGLYAVISALFRTHVVFLLEHPRLCPKADVGSNEKLRPMHYVMFSTEESFLHTLPLVSEYIIRILYLKKKKHVDTDVCICNI